MFIEDEPIIAQCPLEKGSRKVCYLSFQKLILDINGRIYSYELNQIVRLSFQQKLLLLPLIFGGILAPLSLIALINDLLDTWTMLISFMVGSLLIYYGLEGRKTFSILTQVKEYDFFVNTVSKNIKAFILFVEKIKHQEGDPIFYLSIPNNQFEEANELLDFEKGIELFEKPMDKKSSTLFRISPLASGFQIVYNENESGTLSPFLVGRIKKGELLSHKVHREKMN